MTHALHWTHAYNHRLAQKTPSALHFSSAVHTCSSRLHEHLRTDSLPFLSLSFQASLEAELDALLPQVQKYKHMLLLGIGGSSLGAKALQKAFYREMDWPDHKGRFLWVADNVDATSLNAFMGRLNPEETVVVVVSKSGGTIETMSQYFLVQEWLQKNRGPKWIEHVVAITDAKSGALRAEVERHHLLSLPVPEHLGGRYSVFSAVGLLPAAFLGIDYKALLRGARKVAEPLLQSPQNLLTHPAFRLAYWNKDLFNHGYGQLIFFCYIPAWAYMGQWFAQLWAESLGKKGKGTLPVPALGVTDQHSVNQMFLDGPRDKACLFVSCNTLEKGPQFPINFPEAWDYLRGQHLGDLLLAESLGTHMALVTEGVPLVEAALHGTDEEAAGRFMQLLMLTTVFTGWLLEINPLNQPAVELGKRLANARLGAKGYEAEEQALEDFLRAEPKGNLTDTF